MSEEENKKVKKVSEIKSISPLVSQMVLRILGSYCSTQVANDVYYLIKAINMLKSDLGEEYVKKEWESVPGRDWIKTKKNLEKLEKKSMEVKSFYDAIEDKKMEKSKQEIKIKYYYTKTASKIPMILPEAYDLLIMLIKRTEIQRRSIPSEAFRILENFNRKPLDMGNIKSHPPTENKEMEKKNEE